MKSSGSLLYTDTVAYRTLFGKISIPNLSHDFDAIGFDGDYTLIAYKQKEHQRAQLRTTAEVLIKACGYPPSIAEGPDSDFDIAMHGLVMDGMTGCLVKLGPGNVVLRAYMGSRQMAREEVCT